MKFSIIGKTEKELFVSLFQLLKNSSTTISIIFTEEYLHIQGMDKSHICLFTPFLISNAHFEMRVINNPF
jgi:hypothetical protein